VQGLASDTAQRLRFELQSNKGNRLVAIDTDAVLRPVDALQGVAYCPEVFAVDITDDAFHLMIAGTLGRVIGVLQQRLPSRLHLRLPMQLRCALASQAKPSGLQQDFQRDALVS